ncbi:MAG: hypothetical protein KKD33_09985, partial [Verrucomicrobia bacterium]|nr:hypothetical protein [Verrucomicrobiota bacterium]
PKDGVDLLTLNKGIAKSGKLRAENIDRSTDNEFLDYQRAFVKKDGRVIFTIPAEDSPEKYRYVGFGPLPVQPLHRYSLIMESANLATNFINLASITFLKGDTRTHFNGVQYKARSDFGTPPDADRIVVWLGVSAWPNKLTPGPKVEFKSLKVVDRGPLNGTPGLAERPGENLLPVSDFENEPVGEFVNRNYFYPGNGTNVKSGKNIFAEIVADGSNKCLHIVKGKEGYIYPFLKTRTMNLNNCTLVFTCRMKGKGKIQPHIWWWLKGVKGTAWSYYGEGSYDLTGTWQTVRTWRSCVNDSDYAACALAIQSPEADFYVDDLSLTIIPHAVD